MDKITCVTFSKEFALGIKKLFLKLWFCSFIFNSYNRLSISKTTVPNPSLL
ncbi:hypothetical protein K9B05_001751 [Campylobacter jejuni]|nr:hypothetical protein [Campylobacter jejuni]EIB5736784.1 hypothetical protein [Campylobacter jejuni]MCW1644081.1 hypothetical protein [Campylobacter jejuni]